MKKKTRKRPPEENRTNLGDVESSIIREAGKSALIVPAEKAESKKDEKRGVEARIQRLAETNSTSGKKKARRPRKQCPVSHSSQDLQDSDETASQKSSRKRTAVSIFGVIMKDKIIREERIKWEGVRDNN